MATRHCHSEIESEDVYTMRSDPRGHCIIVNNVHFWTGQHPPSSSDSPPDPHVPPDRTGSNIDALKLQELFSGCLKFAVTRRDDVTRDQLHETIIEYQEMDHSNHDALFFIILSHGDRGDIIYTSDDIMIKINDIVKCFSASKCPTLSNKPKVFIIQACRGSECNSLVQLSKEPFEPQALTSQTASHDSGYSTTSTAAPVLINVPDEADTLCAYATIDDHTALRDRKNGSWFIQELVNVIKDHAHNKHLLDLLTIVNNKLSSQHSIGNEVQVSQIKSSLRKMLYFHPRPPLLHTQSDIDVMRKHQLSSSYHTRISVPAMIPEHSPHYSQHYHRNEQYLNASRGQQQLIALHHQPHVFDATPHFYEGKTEVQHPMRNESTVSFVSVASEQGLLMNDVSSPPNSRGPSPPLILNIPTISNQQSLHPPPNVPSLHPSPLPSPIPSPLPSPLPLPIPGSPSGQDLPLSTRPLYSRPVTPDSQDVGQDAFFVTNGCYSFRRPSSNSVTSHFSVKAVQTTYHMGENPVLPEGYCIIINNNTEYYDDEKMNEITEVFSDQLGFHVQVYSSLTRKGIKHLLETVAKIDHYDLYCLAVIILSKGGKERAVYGTDGKKLQVNDLVMLFSRDACHSLEMKPKLFFIETQLTEPNNSQPIEFPDVPHTYIASYYGGLSESKSFLLELIEVLCKDFVFQKATEALMDSHDVNKTLFLCNKLERPLHFIICEEIRDSYNQGRQTVNKISFALEVLIKLRAATIAELKKIKEDIFNICQNARRSKMAGAITSLVGGGLAAIGFGLIPVTFGGSVALSVLGAGVGVAGGAVSIASTVTDKVMSKGKLKQAQAVIDIDRQLTEQVNKLFVELRTIIESIQRKEPGTTRERTIALLLQGHQLVRVGAVAVRGAQITRTVIQGSVFALKVAGPAARGIAVVGGVAAVLTIPLDLYELISNSVKLYKRSDTEATKWFDKQLESLEAQQKEIEQMNEELKREKCLETEV